MKSKEDINKSRRESYKLKKDKINEKRRNEYNLDDERKNRVKQTSLDYYNKNKDIINEKRKGSKSSLDYYYRNKYQQNSEKAKRDKIRMSTDPLFKLSHNIRNLIRISFKNRFTEKSKKTIEILGCSFCEFQIHIENNFDENMNWSNYGNYWELDHIIPISSAKNEEEVYVLNHYTNFQPMYWLDNIRKGNKTIL